MKPYKWLFIFWMASTIYHVEADTEILQKEPPGNGQLWNWHISPNSVTSGAGWIQPTPQKMAYSVCDISSNTEPKNWLTTNFIRLNDAKLLDIKLGCSFRKCPSDSTVKHCKTYLSLYVLHTDRKLTTNECDPGKPGNVHGHCQYEFIGTIAPKDVNKLKPDESKVFTYHAKLVAKARGAYLMFFDQGVCIALKNFTIGYKYCSERGNDLVTFPRTVAPVNDSQLVEKDGKCSDSHSLNKDKLTGVCLSSGEWNVTDGVKCLCMKGYELVGSEPNSLQCKECPKGSYKNKESNTDCVKCPANSTSDTARTGCNCDKGFYKLIAEAPCKTLPRAPLNANITVVKATYVTINWTRSPDDTGRNVLYYIDCFRCVSPKDKECKESCGPGVKYKPRKDNITDVMVTVNGLSSNSIFIFRVYCVSELNKQESDRDKWKYATVRVRTKEEVVTPTKQGAPGGVAFSSEVRMALFIGVPIVVILLIAICIFVVCICRKRNRKGYSSPVELKDGQVILPSHGQRLYIDPSNYEDPEEALKDFAKELDKKWIKLEKIIGGGEFGDVYKGLLTRPEEETILVAVKTLKAGAAPKNRKDFISEASIMGQFCDPNVIFLEGVVTKNLPLMIVIEFMSNGSLDHFLKKMDGNLTVQQLLGMARGVASGMKYLSDMNFVHRDLAARNVLVSEGMVCKVADFGLSRELEDSAYETKGGKIPVRWTALEAIEYRKFTPASDVWSYGVVLWEIMSFAERPYWDWSNYEVMDRVKGGYRLPPPLGCPKAIHQTMLNCWHADRNKRPKFADVVKKLDVLIRSPDKLNDVSSPESPKSSKVEYTELTPIDDWLESIKMGQYSEGFSKAGFTNLKEVTEGDELDFNEMGIKLIGHKNKIRKSLREVKKSLIRDTAF